MQLVKVKKFISKHRLINKGDTIVVAVSGGPDSTCLLHLLSSFREELDLKLIVAHLNHGLRPEAGDEALGVEKISKSLAVPFEAKEVNIKSYKNELGLSEEEAGRRARYEFLFEVARKYGASKIALGHHLDDQAETVLLNLIRGTGVDGLAGMLPKRTRGGFQLVRPLLCLRRNEIELYCLDNSLKTFTDSSNLETNYTRNRLRLDLIPHLECHYNPRIREALFSLASLAADDRKLLHGLAVKNYLKLSRFLSGKTLIDRPGFLALPPALRGRVLRQALNRHSTPKYINKLHIEQLLDIAARGKTGKSVTLPGGLKAYCSYNKLILTSESKVGKEKLTALPVKVPGTTCIPGGFAVKANIFSRHELTWPPKSYQAYLDIDQIPDAPLTVQSRWPGARFYPQGSSGRKKLKDFLIDKKIPAERRNALHLITAGEEIIWLAGIRIAHPYRVTEKTENVLRLEYSLIKRKGNLNKEIGKGGR